MADGSWLSYCEITGIVRRTGQQMVLGQIKRRDFITLVGGAAAAWPLAARAQQPARLPTVGYMGSATPATQGQWAAVFVQRLQELGWTEGRNVKIEVRWAEGRSERFAEIAAEFVALKVNVIVTSGGVVPTVKQATSTIVSSPLTTANRVRINTLALGRRLPAIYDDREFVEVGGLISYGPDFANIYRRAADYVDKILRGAKPGELPVEQPTKFDLVINLTAAKALGLTVPDKLLAIADKVIE